ncbi:MAG: UDP-N-acetylmuramoylalanyl-D-glutamyl-2, 6-diaminopimelate--D-alanyl-D-alanine ligase, partial [Desulfovibrio sp.]|nr:UDP-N-acetylmuramoylalanyl-D-glutamyl-2, 6-diaminopimelate--D-alanyl-D-alanine ligase [Desulfovibrio sp.]
MRLSLDCAARAANAALAEGFRNIPVTAVATDSRAAVPGSLFVCIPGERVDGHDFAESAAAGGACAVLAQRPLPEFAARRPDVPVLEVKDSVAAL